MVKTFCLSNDCIYCFVRLNTIPVYQDVEERQGGSGGHQTCQGSGGREGHVLCKITSIQEFVRKLV